MARDKRVNIKIKVDDQDSKKKLGLLKRTLLGVKTAFGGLGAGLLSIKGILAGGIGLVALNKVLKGTVGRAQSAETGLKRLGVAMKSAARFSNENLQSFERLSVNLERTTGFVEEDVLQALAVLQTFGQMTRADMEKTIVASLNMATVFNEDLTQAAIRLGKAYNGQLVGLQRMGVGISKAEFNVKGFSAVLDQLAKEQGGQAKARMLGFEGSINRISVAFGEVGKELGKYVTKNQTLRTGIDSLAGGMTIYADLLRNNRIALRAQSERVKELTADLREQEDALASVGKEIRNNVLIQRKQELIAIVALLEKTKELKKRQKEALIDIRQPNTFAETTQKIIDLKADQLDIEGKIKILEKDKNIEGSKANKEQIEAELTKIKLLKEEETFLKAIKEVWEASFQGADQLKAALEKTAELFERRTTKVNEQAARERQLLKELATARGDDLGALKIWYENQQELNKNNNKALLALDELYQIKRSQIRIKAEQSSKEFLEDILEEIASDYEDNLKKQDDLETDKLNKDVDRLRMRADAIKQFNQERLSAAMDIVNKELAANERLQQRLLDIRTGAVRQALQDETLNESERTLLLEEQEKAANALFDALQKGSGGSAVELEKNITKLEKQRDLLQDVEGADDILEILRQSSNEAANLIVTLGRAKLSPGLDVEAIKLEMRTTGEAAADEFRIAFENRLRAQPIKIPNVELTPPSFTTGGG